MQGAKANIKPESPDSGARSTAAHEAAIRNGLFILYDNNGSGSDFSYFVGRVPLAGGAVTQIRTGTPFDDYGAGTALIGSDFYAVACDDGTGCDLVDDTAIHPIVWQANTGFIIQQVAGDANGFSVGEVSVGIRAITPAGSDSLFQSIPGQQVYDLNPTDVTAFALDATRLYWLDQTSLHAKAR